MDRRNDLVRSNLSVHKIFFADNISSGGPSSNKSTKMAKEVPAFKFFATETTLFVTQGQVLTSKPLIDNRDASGGEGDHVVFGNEDFVLLKNHSSTISCIGIAAKDWLICACTDDEVVLFKRDALLKTYNSVTIAEGLGRILSCALIVHDDLILTCVAKPNELVLFRSKSTDNPLTEFGLLDLTELEIVGNHDRVNESFTWLQLVFLQDALHVIGMATGNVVSLKIWEVSQEGGFKLKDHRMASQSKTNAGADFAKMDGSEDYILVIVSPEGYSELYSVSSIHGFCLLSRIKLEDFVPGVSSTTNSGDQDNVQLDFRIFSVRFFIGNPGVTSEDKKSDEDEKAEGSIEIEELNSLTEFEARPVECPKVQICIATTKGVAIVNLRSGEIDFVHKYTEFLEGESLMLANAKISVINNSPVINIALQSLLQQTICTFQLNVVIPADIPREGFTLFTIKELEPKSILRKKLKSPPPPPPVKKPSQNARMSQPIKRRSISSGSVPNLSRFQPNKRNSSRLMPPPPPPPSVSKGFNKSFTSSVPQRKCGSAPTSPLPSARTTRLKPKAKYNGYDQLNFSEAGGGGDGSCLTTRLHDPLSHMRMTFTADGQTMAVGGNVAPMIVFKTTPVFEPVWVYKDTRRITALDFSFCNSHHLLIATNDGRTEIVDWELGKELLSLNFNSKFNEHGHSQFYYLDKFILQPEDNRIQFYSFRIANPNSISLNAGTLSMNFQQITALAAPNRFYSSIILCGGSNKCLTVFDADKEQEIVTIPNAHSRPISCIRINEAPKGPGATFLSDLFLTASNSYTDPIKIWDLRIAKCVTRISDVNNKVFVPTSRPAFSPCGKYIASGFEENEVGVYDIRKFNSRVGCFRGRSPVLDVSFDPNFTMLWFGCRNGNLWNFNTL